ncbi:hypothetical protein TrLO_g5069 [Triparma laevis f. longispina]|uniref:Uncharacterized protein n=1 Tax=Triparma laevis f. longispina TaxID=1714387 RepID=A0A9W6ZH94_9STRA|nr:hypothetical protein TrLO_g5069 [Triparma laevis f. longispina]
MFANNESRWAPIGGDVEAWVGAGWNNWEQEKPKWFTDNWKAIVPKDMIPLKKEGGVVEAGEDVPVVECTTVIRQEARRKSSSVPALINAALGIEPVANKVAPAGNVKREEVIDVQEFKREMERQGSMNL